MVEKRHHAEAVDGVEDIEGVRVTPPVLSLPVMHLMTRAVDPRIMRIRLAVSFNTRPTSHASRPFGCCTQDLNMPHK